MYQRQSYSFLQETGPPGIERNTHPEFPQIRIFPVFRKKSCRYIELVFVQKRFSYRISLIIGLFIFSDIQGVVGVKIADITGDC